MKFCVACKKPLDPETVWISRDGSDGSLSHTHLHCAWSKEKEFEWTRRILESLLLYNRADVAKITNDIEHCDAREAEDFSRRWEELKNEVLGRGRE